MTQALACLLFPLMRGCAPFVDYTATTGEILQNTAYYASRPVVVTGRVRSLKQLRGASFGTPAETFLLCDGACVHVFMREHTAISDGDRVSVRGVFATTHRVGKMLFRNDIAATEIFTRQ